MNTEPRISASSGLVDRASKWNVWLKLAILLTGWSLVANSLALLWATTHVIPYDISSADQLMLITQTAQTLQSAQGLIGWILAGMYILISWWERPPASRQQDHRLGQVVLTLMAIFGLSLISSSLFTQVIYLPLLNSLTTGSEIVALILTIIGIALIGWMLAASWARKQQLIRQYPAEDIFV